MSRAVAQQQGLLKVHEHASLSQAQLEELTLRPRIDFASIISTVCNYTSLAPMF
jgi:hypothetical protein